MTISSGLEFSTALEASHIMHGGLPCRISGKGSICIDATAPTATYYLQFMDLVQPGGTLPGNGAVTLRCGPIPVDHANLTDDIVDIDFGDDGCSFPNGCAVVLSTTQFTKTLAGPYLVLLGSSAS